MSRFLDFSLLPEPDTFDSCPLVIGLSDSAERSLASMPAVAERLKASIALAMQANKHDEMWLAAAYLRAGLAEFCSAEDMHRLHCPEEKSFKIHKCPNPLLHTVKLLRNLNIHVETTPAVPGRRTIEWGKHVFELDVATVSNVSTAQLLRLEHAKKYRPEDLNRMADWFNDSQAHLGACNVIRVAANTLAHEIALHHARAIG